MDIIDRIWDAHLRKIGTLPLGSNSDSLRAIATELSLRYPISTQSIYRSLVSLLYAFETTIQLSATTGQDASVLMDCFISNAAKGITNDIP